MKGIYAILNVKENKRYIGQSFKIETRYYNHIWKLKNNRHENEKLQEAWNNGSEDDFVLEILEVVKEKDRDKLLILEKQYINEYDSYNNGYNNSYGADGSEYYVATEEFKKLQSERMKNNTFSLGIKRSEETKKKMSEAFKHRNDLEEHSERGRKTLKRLWQDEDFRNKVITLNTGNQYSKGRKATEKERKQMSERQKGENNSFYNKNHSEESKKVMSVKSKERWKDDEYRTKVRSKMDKIMQSDEYKQKISEKSKGENNNSSKVTELDVIKIRLRYLNGEKPKEILKDYNMLSIHGIKKICNNTTWKHIPNNKEELKNMLINYQSK